MKYLATILALLAAACGPTWNAEYEGDPTENAIAAYESVHGALSAECRARAESLEVDYADLTSVRDACPDLSPNVVGCLDKYDVVSSHAWIAEGQGPDVLAHETMHVILRCARPSDVHGNHDHADRVWADSRLHP